MRMISTTKAGQGVRPNDFSWTQEGEIAGIGFECDGEAIDGRCGCRRSFTGMTTHKATTTAKVVDTGLSREEYISRYIEASVEAWGDDKEIREISAKDAEMMLSFAEGFPVGTILEKRGSKIQERKV